MYHKHHTKGIVISGRNENDNDRRINIFTDSFGLINAKVSGARNLHSKLRSGLQDFSTGDFSLVSGKGGWKVVSIRPEKNFFEIFRNDSEKLKIITNVLNLIKKLTAEEARISNEKLLIENQEENKSSVFEIVLNFFLFLEKTISTLPAREQIKNINQDQDIALAEALTLMRILHSLGFMRHDPELLIPMSSSEISITDLKTIAPKRSKIISLINESLKAT